MVSQELELIVQHLLSTDSPEAIFGPIEGSPEEKLRLAKTACRRLEKVTHPDCYVSEEDKTVATEAFKRLQQLWAVAQERIADGTYGRATPLRASLMRVSTKKRDYEVRELRYRGDICDLYSCTYSLDGKESLGIFKVARDPADDDLVSNEARVLRRLQIGEGHEKFQAYLPDLVEALRYSEGASADPRQANVVSNIEGLYSLKEVRAYYTEGVDPRDMAWIWRRLLVVLGFAHRNGVVHGAVLPDHLLIQPERHGLVLVDWSYAVCDPKESGERIQAINVDYAGWYPPEVLAKKAPTFGVDIYMGARCMIYLLGGDPLTGGLPMSVPKAIRAFFKGCLLTSAAGRPQNAWSLLQEFDELIERLWGPRRFRPFYLPKK